MSGKRIIVLGLSVTSSYGNGHATTFRGLLDALADRGHDILFLERDLPIYRDRRDLESPSFCEVRLYADPAELSRFDQELRSADAIIIGSYVKDGPKVIDHVLSITSGHDIPVLFYDIDTPVTVALLDKGECPYLRRDQVPRFDAYLSFTGGPMLEHIEDVLGAKRAWPLYCNVDPDLHAAREEEGQPTYQLGYLGTYSEDRQPGLDRFLLEPARIRHQDHFIVAGPLYPDTISWPYNVERVEHIPPEGHVAFYGDQRFTLNLTRAAMRRWGHSPSVRLFEAAACGTPIITDRWAGIEEFFAPGTEVRVVDDTADVLAALEMDDEERRAMGRAAQRRVKQDHTGDVRAATLESYLSRLQHGPFVSQEAS